MATRKKPSTIAQAKKAKSKTFYGKGNKKLAAVTKEELKESGFKSLRDYLNNQQGKTRRTAAKVAPRPKPKPASKVSVLKETKLTKTPTGADLYAPEIPKKYVDSGQRPDSRPVKSTPKSKPKTPTGTDLSAPEIPKSKSRPRRGSSAPLGGKADPFKYVGKGKRGQKGQAPVPTTEEKVAMAGLALSALGGPGTIAGKAAIKAATKFGKPYITNLIKKIKDLAPKQQKEVLKAVNKGKTKTEAEKLGQDSMRVFKGGKSLKRDQVEPYKANASTPLTSGQSSASRTMDAARQSQRKEIDPGYTGGALKRGGQIKKYNKGGKVVKRKEGGQVMSGSDLVSSLYN